MDDKINELPINVLLFFFFFIIDDKLFDTRACVFYRASKPACGQPLLPTNYFIIIIPIYCCLSIKEKQNTLSYLYNTICMYLYVVYASILFCK